MQDNSKDITSVKIAVVMPSRGEVRSRTVECLVNNLRGLKFELYMSHNRPIPECFNEPLEKALAIHPDYIWFVEEDMNFAFTTLREMIAMDEFVVSVDYTDKNNDWGKSFIHHDREGNVLFTGMGCMLVKSEVFKELKRPYIQQCLMVDGKIVSVGPRPNAYGTQDVYFCHTMRQAGYDIAIMNTMVGHIDSSGHIKYPKL